VLVKVSLTLVRAHDSHSARALSVTHLWDTVDLTPIALGLLTTCIALSIVHIHDATALIVGRWP